MSTFEFSSVTRIVFGRGQSRRLGEIVQSIGSAALIVHNGPVPPTVEAAVTGAGLRTVFVRQHGEPKVDDVDRWIAAAREGGCDVVVGVGGGSAIDAAKAVAGLLTNG